MCFHLAQVKTGERVGRGVCSRPVYLRSMIDAQITRKVAIFQAEMRQIDPMASWMLTKLKRNMEGGT